MLKIYKNLLWTIPFMSFIGGYFLLDTLYHQKEIETPTVIGKSIEQALAILSKYNLNTRLLTHKEDEALPSGTIVSQTPAPSQIIKQNQSVLLVISVKPKKIKAPNLLGQSLKNIDLTVKEQKIVPHIFHIESNYPQGQCFAQHPIPGSELEKDNMLMYVSAANPKMVLVPHFKNKSIDLVLAFLKTQNITYEITHVPSLPLDHQCEKCVVLDQRPLGGSIITLDQKKPLHVQLQVTRNETI